MKRTVKWLAILSVMFFFGALFSLRVEAGSIYTSPYVELAPDGLAWTACPGETHNYMYPKGYMVDTGMESALRELQTGEHYYKYKRTGEIPVGEWRVEWADAACIHSGKREEGYHGLDFGNTVCGAYYTQGWFAYCADCHQRIAKILMYMCEDAAQSITSIPMGMDYYYLCPFCTHLEQGSLIPSHTCEKISWNRYKIRYEINISVPLATGTKPRDSYHMYHNATEYEGETVTSNTRLAKMNATVLGYEFVGWNTEPDGSGTWYADEQEIYNLTEYDCNYDTRGTIILYAQWKRSESTLVIDPAGGSYLGNDGITVYIKQVYDSQNLYPETIVAPAGATLHFETNGGAAVADMQVSSRFERWETSMPFGGKLEGNVYHFYGKSGTVDRLTAVYMPIAITLPEAEKKNSSFGGWYYDEECKKPAGAPGDKITIREDTTLYAQWVELQLDSEENYDANNEKGAVDLAWSQPDLQQKAYRIYRYASSGEKDVPGADAEWTLINSTLDERVTLTVKEQLSYSGGKKTYTVPYTGIYKLTAAGAQGGNYGGYKGGYGGKAEGTFWLNAGDVITYTIGGHNGYNGGGEATDYGNGGGATVVTSAEQGTLLVAAGGGGATGSENGKAGGGTPSANLLSTGYAGENGSAGGGGGYQGGKAGVLHTHGTECYTVGSDSAGSVFYHTNALSKSSTMYSYQEDGSFFTNTATSSFVNGILCDGDSYYTAQIGNSSTYFTTSGAGTLTFSLSYDNHESHTTDMSGTNRIVRVFSNTGQEIFSRNLSTISGVTTTIQDSGWCEDGCKKVIIYTKAISTNNVTGTTSYRIGDSWYCNTDERWHGIESYWNANLTISVPISDNVDGIYIVVEGTPDATSNRIGITVSNVKFSYDYLNCGLAEVSTPAYGGSSYVNTALCNRYSYTHGSNIGNGYFSIQSEDIGFVSELTAEGVSAPDLAAPDSVSGSTVTMEPVAANDNRNVVVGWRTPSDNGTDYYFLVESHKASTGVKLCSSNIRMHTITTGVKGYYYLINTASETKVTASNGTYTVGNRLQVALTSTVQYLHLAPVDVAGNVGATATVRLGSVSGSDTPPDVQIPWPVYTEQMYIKEGEGVYPATGENIFYVRCDNATPLELSFNAYIDGVATSKYQITHSIFESRLEGAGIAQNIVITPLHDVAAGEIVTEGSGLNTDTEGASVLSPYLYNVTTRTNNNRNLAVVSRFLIGAEADGKTIRVTPTAGVVTSECSVYSDSTRDFGNSLYLIGDSAAPIIQGTDLLEDALLIDREAGEVVFGLQASDAVSGLAYFAVDIYNEDNGGCGNWTADESGTIVLELTEDVSLFAGDLTITLVAVDNVGNVCEEIYHVTELDLETKLERILTPHEPVFLRGESGILTVETWGHMERVEVEFPEGLGAYDETFEYVRSNYKTEESIQFMIPLYGMEDGSYEIRVRAYKGEHVLEDLLMFSVSGTILDELRTRLR